MSFLPVYNQASEILILGTYPSPKSREQGFYYGHPQNRFWRLMAALFEEAVPESIEQKKQLLLSHHIALWDVCDSCEIDGAADSSIRQVVPNDIAALLDQTSIHAVLCNGVKAHELFCRYEKNCLQSAVTLYKLPSTSPANAAFGMERLFTAWEPVIRRELAEGYGFQSSAR